MKNKDGQIIEHFLEALASQLYHMLKEWKFYEIIANIIIANKNEKPQKELG